MPVDPVVAVIPAKDEAARIGATVAAAAAHPGGRPRRRGRRRQHRRDVGHRPRGRRRGRPPPAQPRQGGGDDDRRRARRAATSGTRCRRGPAPPRRPLLFVDADLEASAPPTSACWSPPVAGRHGGHDHRDPAAAADGRRRQRLRRPPRRATGSSSLTGWRGGPAAVRHALPHPRGLRRRRAPLARGWGVEVGLTVDVLRAGLRDRRGALRAAPPGHRLGLARPAAPRPASTATWAGPRPPAAASCRGLDPAVGRCRTEPDPQAPQDRTTAGCRRLDRPRGGARPPAALAVSFALLLARRPRRPRAASRRPGPAGLGARATSRAPVLRRGHRGAGRRTLLGGRPSSPVWRGPRAAPRAPAALVLASPPGAGRAGAADRRRSARRTTPTTRRTAGSRRRAATRTSSRR